MKQAKKGDTVRVHYTGKFEDGTVFDSSDGREPLQFRIGDGLVIPGFENAVEGMNPGAAKVVDVPADMAYGPYREEMIVAIGKEKLPLDLEPKTGDMLQVQLAGGNAVHVVVTDVSESGIIIDANHPLAGKDLTFDIELVEIV